jgi:hypothetical protein
MAAPQCLSDITERCEAILIKIYQNSEGTEQSFARHGRILSPPTPSAAMAATQCAFDVANLNIVNNFKQNHQSKIINISNRIDTVKASRTSAQAIINNLNIVNRNLSNPQIAK